MKKIIKLLLAVACCVLLQVRAFCVEDGNTFGMFGQQLVSAEPSSQAATVVTAAESVIAQLVNSTNAITKQLVDMYNAIFVNPKTDGVIGSYIKNFYSWFATDNFSSLFPVTSQAKNIDDKIKNQDSTKAIRKQLSKEIGYNTKKNALEKFQDTQELFKLPFESSSSSDTSGATSMFGLNTFGQSQNSNSSPPPPSPYGSLDNSSPVADQAPSIIDLIGSDGYANDDAQNKAKLFISYVLQSIPPPKNIFIPDKSTASKNDKGKSVVTMNMPYASADFPYTPVEIPLDEYGDAIDYLNSESKYYQPYIMKVRALNILRTLYSESIRRAYQERIGGSDGKSLVEREKELAFSGLNKEYYDNLKNKSMADVNLEILQAINKLTYFVYKLHQDNERMSLVMATSGMQLTTQGIQDESTYIKPISVLIDKKCWKRNQDDFPGADKPICANPMSGTQPKIH